jgi:hypothetical protein
VGRWYLPRSLALAEVRGTEIERLPTIMVDSSGLHCLRRGPEAFDAGLFVVWLELDSSRPSPEMVHELLDPQEQRPIVHISAEALVVYKQGEIPRPLSWDGLVQREGRISVSGEVVVDWLAGQLRHRALDAWMLGAAAVLLAQFVALLILVALHRLLFSGGGKGRPKGLATAGALAAIPPTVLTAVLGCVGLPQGAVLGLYLATFGLTFLLMATQLGQIGDEAGSDGSAPAIGPSSGEPELGPLGGIDRADLAAMKERGLLRDEDYAIAQALLSGTDESSSE